MFDEKEGEQIFFSSETLNPIIHIITYIFFTAILIALIYYTIIIINPLKICNDETPNGKCSQIQPFYCNNGKLIERASTCGCPEITYGDGEKCISKYQNQSKNITLNYVLRGKEGEINYTVYKGLMDYLHELPRTIFYLNGESPLRQDFKIKKIYEAEQRELILPLIIKIQEITSDKEDQVRIAISLVQKIEFGFSDKLEFEFGQKIPYQRYPYEVLYEQKGICGEKSELLTLLLKELGYETTILYYQKENHEAVGIACPVENSLNNSGYCFIETTGSSIFTNDKIVYAGTTRLQSNPEIIFISNGTSLNKKMYEYKDAKTLIKINNKIEIIGRINPLDIFRLNKLTKKYNLESYYDPR